jgi:hypothetical protein
MMTKSVTLRTALKVAALSGVVAGIVGSTVFLAQPAHANSAFAQASRQPCAACHLPGRETDAPNSGFNPAGQSVYSAFVGTCNYHIDCAINMAFPGGAAPPQAPAYNQQPPVQPPPQPQPGFQPQPQPGFQPQPQPASNPPRAPDGTTATQAGLARFDDTCNFQGNFFVVRIAGNPNNLLRFMLKNGHKVHIDVPVGSVYAAQCGQFPGANAGYAFIRLD